MLHDAFCPDIKNLILYNLNDEELYEAMSVSKAWRQDIRELHLYKRFFPMCKPLPDNFSYEQHEKTYGVKNLSQLKNKIFLFSLRLNPKHNGILHCYFPKITNAHLSIKLCSNKNSKEFQVIDHIWFMNSFPLKYPMTEVIDQGENHGYYLHTRFPKESRFNAIKHYALQLLIARDDYLTLSVYKDKIIKDENKCNEFRFFITLPSKTLITKSLRNLKASTWL